MLSNHGCHMGDTPAVDMATALQPALTVFELMAVNPRHLSVVCAGSHPPTQVCMLPYVHVRLQKARVFEELKPFLSSVCFTLVSLHGIAPHTVTSLFTCSSSRLWALRCVPAACASSCAACFHQCPHVYCSRLTASYPSPHITALAAAVSADGEGATRTAAMLAQFSMDDGEIASVRSELVWLLPRAPCTHTV